MESLVENQLDQLERELERLFQLVAAAHATIEEQVKEKEETALKNMDLGRRLRILKENVDQTADVATENDRLREKNAQAAEHAARLLAHVRELQRNFNP